MKDGGEGGHPVVKLLTTRLMLEGRVPLWLEGRIIWDGAVGAVPEVAAFDVISMNVVDAARLEEKASHARVIEVLATWWEIFPIAPGPNQIGGLRPVSQPKAVVRRAIGPPEDECAG